MSVTYTNINIFKVDLLAENDEFLHFLPVLLKPTTSYTVESANIDEILHIKDETNNFLHVLAAKNESICTKTCKK